MTISSTTSRFSYLGNGSTVNFSFPAYFQAPSDLVVIQTVIATGIQSTMMLNSDYVVSGTTDSNGFYPNGGSVNFTVAPPSTVSLALYRDPPATQTTAFVDNESLPAATLEAVVDKQTTVDQRTRELALRALRQPDGDSDNIATIPPKVLRASTYLGFDANGDPTTFTIANGGTSVPVSAAMTPVVEAASLAAGRTAMGVMGLGDSNTLTGSITGGSISATTITGCNVLDNTRLAKTDAYTVANADKGKTIALGGSACYTLTFSAASGFDANFAVRVVNEDTGRGKAIALNGGSTFILWPGQSCDLFNQNNKWRVNPVFQRWAHGVTFNVDTASGSDVSTNDGLGTGSGAFATIGHALQVIIDQIDCQGSTPEIKVADGSTITEQIAAFSGQPFGADQVIVTGNLTSGSQIPWNATANNQTLVQARDNGILTVQGFKFSAGSFTGCVGLNPSQNGTIDYNSCEFAAFPSGNHIQIDQGGSCNCTDANGSTIYTISGNMTYHIFMTGPCKHTMGGVTVTMPNALTFTAFIKGQGPGCLDWGFNAFSGTGSGTGSTGLKYALDGNFAAYLGGSTLPGATAGNIGSNGTAFAA